MKTQSCKIIDVKECDILYQVTYQRVCDHCGKQEDGMKERKFLSVLKNGKTMDIDNWHCPNCGRLNITEIVCDK